MKAKKIQAIQRRILRILNTWKDPHTDVVLAESPQIQGIEVAEDGSVQLAITPQRPHCPCCLDGLIDLRNEVNAHKNILACHIEIIGVPQSGRWTAAINE